jgi:hypothetical protein
MLMLSTLERCSCSSGANDDSHPNISGIRDDRVKRSRTPLL